MATESVFVDARADGEIPPGTDISSDVRLVRSLIGGSEWALGVLYDRHGRGVFGAAMRASGDRAIAAEVVQETFLALWDRAELFDPTRGTLAAWLARIARNRAIDRLRAAARHERAVTFSSFVRNDTDDHSIADWLTSAGELVGVGGPQPAPETALVDQETRRSIEDAFGSLDPVERQVIGLAYGRGLSQSEIASQLGWPIGTVKTRTRRALRHLRDRLEGPAGPMPADAVGPGRDRAGYAPPTLAGVPPVRGECPAPC